MSETNILEEEQIFCQEYLLSYFCFNDKILTLEFDMNSYKNLFRNLKFFNSFSLKIFTFSLLHILYNYKTVTYVEIYSRKSHWEQYSPVDLESNIKRVDSY